MPVPRFSDLCRLRVRDILLVSSLYDSFILAEDGELQEVILKEFLDLNVRHSPGVTHVSTCEEAVRVADRMAYDLVIASAHLGEVSAPALAERLRSAGLDAPVVALAYDMREVEVVRLSANSAGAALDRVFLWQGDVRLLPAIVKYVEDRWNVAHDTGLHGVQAILVVEDNVRYYSSFLPTIYAEVMHHAHRLVPEGLNLSHKLMRLQAQPKILLCGSYEEAWSYFTEFQQNILGIVSDIEFPREGTLSRDAGLELARQVRQRQPDVPVMLQSSRPDNQMLARSVGASFLLKGSPTLLHQLRRFMIEHLGFGDFVFKTPDGRQVGRARDMRELEQSLAEMPAESIAYHAERNHFSKWLKARTEFAVADRLRPHRVSDFESIEDLRATLLTALQEYRQDTRRGVVVDFDRSAFTAQTPFSRLGGGSVGGKARGLAFVDWLLSEARVSARFPGVSVTVPPLVVLGTEVFDDFLDRNRLRDVALEAVDDGEIEQRFVHAELPPAIAEDLRTILDRVRYPIAVRSSSLLEDSQYQPFAGIYKTFMLPNDHPRADVRLRQLLTTVKRVYASTFGSAAKRYLSGGPYRLEEEKMAVVLQRLVGTEHGPRFYPDFAGVARSYNYFPIAPIRPEDGITAVALGLGETVVAGERCFRFCPRYPRQMLQFSSVPDTLANAQREFYALELGAADSVGTFLPARFTLAAAEGDGTLASVGSTFSPENDVVYDGVSRPGVRLVTFAPILKHGLFPLAELVDAVLAVAAAGTGAPVELEFAVTLAGPSRGGSAEFGIVQLRPLAPVQQGPIPDLKALDPARLICRSSSVLGHGTVDDIRDIVLVDLERFDRLRSREIAQSVAKLNAVLLAERLPYLLIGVGRWGSADPLLGIPVTWDQIAGARAIVEATFGDSSVVPSQGSHFFHNLAAGNVGYFTVGGDPPTGSVDWGWLAAQPATWETEFVKHLRFRTPISVWIDGRARSGAITKP